MTPERAPRAEVHFSKSVNLSLLIGGYALGQGAVFIAQTWLVAIGDFRLLANFGTHLLFAILGTLAVDAGSIVTLARCSAAASPDAPARQSLWQSFWDTTLFRMSVALVLVAVAVLFAFSPATNGFSRNYVLFAAPALIFFAVNGAGLLDGFKFSGVSGLTGAIPYATSALVVPFARLSSEESAGALLGAAFSIGCLLTVSVQLLVLTRFGWRPRARATSLLGLRTAIREGGAMLGVMLPGQLCGRAQLILSHAYLGDELTALFLYAKQVVVAANQAIGFIQRIEFPGLVARISICDEKLLRTTFVTQRLVVAAAIFATAGVVLVGVALGQWPESRFAPLAPLLCVFAFIILTTTLLITMVQALAAIRAYEGIAFDTMAFNFLGVVASYMLVRDMGVYAFAAADLLSTLFGAVLLASRLQRSKQSLASVIAG